MSERKYKFVEIKGAKSKLITPQNKIVSVIGNDFIRNSFEDGALDQIVNIAEAPGIDEAVINPDGHQGYGCPVGSVFASRSVVYPNAVGPDVKCSMSFLQFNIPVGVLSDKRLRAKLVKAIDERIPFGAGNHMPPKARPFDLDLLRKVAIEGASREVLEALNIPVEWNMYCEDASHGIPIHLQLRLNHLMSQVPALEGKLRQLGGVGGGNHFLECSEVKVEDAEVAEKFGLVNGNVGFLCHFGSRGFGFSLTSGCKGWPGQFRLLADKFRTWHIPFPGKDDHNVYVPVGTQECDDYLNDMALGANFATVNHLLVCAYVREAFTEVLGDTVDAYLVYYIAHNIISRELLDGNFSYVHRKGATRALPAKHPTLKGTPFYDVGHPILLPGNPVDGSTIMVGRNSRVALNSVNHGAGRRMSRRQASQTFTQRDVNERLEAADIITNCGRSYPVDECPDAYKPYGEVIDSVVQANLASVVARLRPVMNIKDSDTRAETSA